MKIVMTDPSLFTGLYDDGLCAALASAGHDVTLYGRPLRQTDGIAPHGYGYRPRFFPLSERVRDALGNGVVIRTAKAAEYMMSACFWPAKELRAADVVHAQWLPFPLADRRMLGKLGPRRGKRPVLVHTVHNASAFHGDSEAQARGYRALLDRFDALIVHGDTTRQALVEQGIEPERLHIVAHPPMELATARHSDLAAVADPRKPRILFFGTIRPYKGFDVLLDAGKILWGEGLEFELAVAGNPFMDIAPLLDGARAAGFSEHLLLDLGFHTEERLDAHLRKADIIAFPYRHIDSSGAFLSALHYGKAMVATRVGMFAELDEDRVRLCAPDDPAALADALRPLIGEAKLRRHLGAGARALHSALGQWDAAAVATLTVYERARARAESV